MAVDRVLRRVLECGQRDDRVLVQRLLHGGAQTLDGFALLREAQTGRERENPDAVAPTQPHRHPLAAQISGQLCSQAVGGVRQLRVFQQAARHREAGGQDLPAAVLFEQQLQRANAVAQQTGERLDLRHRQTPNAHAECPRDAAVQRDRQRQLGRCRLSACDVARCLRHELPLLARRLDGRREARARAPLGRPLRHPRAGRAHGRAEQHQAGFGSGDRPTLQRQPRAKQRLHRLPVRFPVRKRAPDARVASELLRLAGVAP